MSWLNFASVVAGAGLGVLAVMVPVTAPVVGPVGSALVMAGLPSLGSIWARFRKNKPINPPVKP